MAKILFGDNIADMRGKVSGSVYARNRYGAIRRTKTSPVNRQTSYQMAVRQSFASFATQWRELEQEQRNGWNDAAPNFQITNVFGQQKTLTGLALFVSLNQNLATIGETMISDAPAPGALPTISFTQIVFQEGGAYSIEAALSGSNEGIDILWYATPPVSPGISTGKNKFRFIQFTEETSSTDLHINYNTRFAPLTAGQKVFVQARPMNNTTGQAGVPISTYTIVEAPDVPEP